MGAWKPWYSGALVIAFLLSISVVYSVMHFWPKSDPYKKDKAGSVHLDSAHGERKDSSAKVDVAIAKLEHKRKASLDEADRIHTGADTLGQHAETVRDSLEMWHSRDSAHVAEIAQLRSVIRDDALEKLLYKKDRAEWVTHSDSLVRGMDTLRKDLEKAQSDQCRILPFIPCLSRKQSLIVGAAGGALVASHPQETVKAIKKLFGR